MKRAAVAVLLSGLTALLTLGFSGCGGSSTPPIAVSLIASSTGIDQAQIATLTASVTEDTSNAGVQWGVSGGGTLSGETTTSATYDAPPSVPTAFTATVTATSKTDPTKSAAFQIKVNPPPAITTTSLTSANAGIPYTSTLGESGGTSPYKWTVTSGTLPTGLSLTSNSGVISGTPTGASSGSVTFQITDAAGISASQAITVTVNPPAALTISTMSLPAGTIGTAYSQTLQATGGVPAYKWSVTTGSLPAGLTLSSAGVISGTPTGTATSTSTFTVTVTDSQTPTAASASATLSITVVEPPLSVTTTSLVSGSIGNAYSQTLQAIGGTPPYTWSISAGTLPAGLSLNSSTGGISGTPSATGTSDFTAKVTDSAAATATAALSITINTALAITTTTLPAGSIGTVYSATVSATGGAQPYTWSLTSGTLPAGLSLGSASGVISGTPTTTGTSDFTVTATDSESPAVQVNAALSIVINSASCPNNSSLNGHYAMMLTGWSGPTTVTAAVGSFVASGGTISGGSLDFNDQTAGPASGTFTGTYCVGSDNLATINLTYGDTLSGTDTFAAALNSSGSNGTIIVYDSSTRKATGLLRQQDTSGFATDQIKGNYAFRLVGADGGGTAPRYASAGQFTANGTANLSGVYDSDLYGSLPVSDQTLSSSDLSAVSSSTGRGTLAITFNGSNAQHSTLSFVFYVVSASELLLMEDDAAGYSLLTGRVLQQSGTFTDASLDGIGVFEIESLNDGTMASATAGLLTTTGNSGTFTLSADQNLGGTISTLSESGTYSTSANGRVVLTIPGEANPPVLYLIGPNQAFVVGTDLAVTSGVIEPQSGSNFNNASLTGAYLGGSFQPVDASVNEDIDDLQANGSGAFTGTSDQNGSAGTSTNSIAETYAVSSNGRVVVNQNGSQVGILYIISDSEFVLLPASTADTNPALGQFLH